MQSLPRGQDQPVDQVRVTLPVSFAPLTKEHLPGFRHLHQVVFPVKYRAEFYDECLASGPFTQLALYGEEVVGAIGTRLERLTTPAAPQQASRLYIMTLGVLAPFRSHGIGSRLLQIILQLASMDPAVTEAYLHVHVVNNDAFDFYARWGFQHGGIVENYYRRIEPRHAVILRKPLTGAYTASLASFSA